MRDASTEPQSAAHPEPAQRHGAGDQFQARIKARALVQPLRAGTRGSPLALVQTRALVDQLWDFCPVLRGMEVFEEHIITTSGDTSQESGQRLADIGGKGLWAKEIHEALLDRRIDFAVHSLKDLETELPPGIVLAATLKREDARDALILGLGAGKVDPQRPLDNLPKGATIGSSSVRRQSQLLHARPDLNVIPLRGNVHTRLDKVRNGALDGTLLALAGLRRLKLDQHATVILDPEIFVPAACQGIVGVTVRADDTELLEDSGGDRGPGIAGEGRRRARPAGGTGRHLPHPDRRPCAIASGHRRAVPDRAGGTRRRQLPAQALAERTAGGGRAYRPGTRQEPARRQPERRVRRMSGSDRPRFRLPQTL